MALGRSDYKIDAPGKLITIQQTIVAKPRGTE